VKGGKGKESIITLVYTRKGEKNYGERRTPKEEEKGEEKRGNSVRVFKLLAGEKRREEKIPYKIPESAFRKKKGPKRLRKEKGKKEGGERSSFSYLPRKEGKGRGPSVRRRITYFARKKKKQSEELYRKERGEEKRRKKGGRASSFLQSRGGKEGEKSASFQPFSGKLSLGPASERREKRGRRKGKGISPTYLFFYQGGERERGERKGEEHFPSPYFS